MRDFTVADQRAHVVVIETETGKAVHTEEVKDGSTPPRRAAARTRPRPPPHREPRAVLHQVTPKPPRDEGPPRHAARR